MQIATRDADIRMPRRITHFRQRATAGQGMADERVPAMVDRQRFQPLQSQHFAGRAKSFPQRESRKRGALFAATSAPCRASLPFALISRNTALYRDATGQLRRHPLSADKKSAQAMLNELVRQVEREKAGLADPADIQRKRSLIQHLAEYRRFLQNKGVTPKQALTAHNQVQKMITDCKWRWVREISATGALEFLADLQRAGRSVQTRNHYLKSAKSFTRWLVRDRRTSMDALAHLSRLNVNTDRRHDRRALSPDEFSRLLEAARMGQPVESISGPDRAMMYTLAAWTGFRKGEIGSLTLRSLDLDADPPTATVAASFSKRRREDTQVLHPELVTQLKTWIAGKPDLKARRSPLSRLRPCSRRHRPQDAQDDADGPGSCEEEMD